MQLLRRRIKSKLCSFFFHSSSCLLICIFNAPSSIRRDSTTVDTISCWLLCGIGALQWFAFVFFFFVEAHSFFLQLCLSLSFYFSLSLSLYDNSSKFLSSFQCFIFLPSCVCVGRFVSAKNCCILLGLLRFAFK